MITRGVPVQPPKMETTANLAAVDGNEGRLVEVESGDCFSDPDLNEGSLEMAVGENARLL